MNKGYKQPVKTCYRCNRTGCYGFIAVTPGISSTPWVCEDDERCFYIINENVKRQKRIEEKPKRLERSKHRRVAVCAECNQPWPCTTALPNRCSAITASGSQCRHEATRNELCRMHDRMTW